MHKYINMDYVHLFVCNIYVSAKIKNMEKKIRTTGLLRKLLE